MIPFAFNMHKVVLFTFLIILGPSLHLQAQLSDFDNIDFVKADSISSLYPSHSLADLGSLSNKLTVSLSTDVEKFRAIYKWVCLNIENDYDLYTRNKSKREKLNGKTEELRAWNEKFGPQVFKRLLNEHKTVCTGYAYLVKELAYHAGITCEIVNGYGRTAQANVGGPGIPNHSWNSVKLNNQWYLCDATWSSGSIDTQEAKFLKEFSDVYFLAEPAVFLRNHYPLDTSWILLKEKPVLKEFLNSPLIYKGALTHQIIPVTPEEFDISVSKGEKVDFSFTGNPKAGQVELQIVKGSSVASVKPDVRQHSAGLYILSHVFSRKGKHVIHMLLNGEYLFTYTVNVSK